MLHAPMGRWKRSNLPGSGWDYGSFSVVPPQRFRTSPQYGFDSAGEIGSRFGSFLCVRFAIQFLHLGRVSTNGYAAKSDDGNSSRRRVQSLVDTGRGGGGARVHWLSVRLEYFQPADSGIITGQSLVV